MTDVQNSKILLRNL